MDLSYLGTMPGQQASTMPAAVPNGAGAPISAIMDAIKPSAPMGPEQAGNIFPFLPPGTGPAEPGLPKYEAVTQQDGSILLHMRMPDGSMGPVVKIINPIKPRQQAGGPSQPM